MHATAAIALLTAAISLAAIAPASAGRGHGGHPGRVWQSKLAGQAIPAQPGSGLTITQNGNGNAASAVQTGGGGAINITQNGNNNSVTVIQLNRAGRGGRGPRPYGWR